MTAWIEPRDGYEVVNGLKLHYLDWGTDGKPYLLLLHGFSSHAHYWDGFSVKMRADFHVIALDQRGHGDSAWADAYPPEAMPADLDAFVRQRGIARFVLLGHAMGGNVAMRFAAEHPAAVERLVVVDAGLPHPEHAPNPDNSVSRALAREEFQSEEDIVLHFQRLNPRTAPERIRRSIPLSFRRTPEGRLTFKFDPALRRNRIGLNSDAEAHRRAEALRAAACNIPCPVLLLRGETSDMLSTEAAHDTAASLPNCTLVEIPGAGHAVPTDNPPAFLAAVRHFLCTEPTP